MYNSDPSDFYSFYDPDHNHREDRCCSQCEEKEQTFDNAAHFLEAIVKQLYSKEPLDKTLLEFQLDELCYYLRVKPISGDLTIQRHEEKPQELQIASWLNNWVIENNKHLRSI